MDISTIAHQIELLDRQIGQIGQAWSKETIESNRTIWSILDTNLNVARSQLKIELNDQIGQMVDDSLTELLLQLSDYDHFNQIGQLVQTLIKGQNQAEDLQKD